MSEAESQQTSILLPESGMAVFSKDSETLEAARALQEDWRFARVSIGIEEGDVDTAISSYQEFASPDLIIIQTDTIDEAFTDKLGELAGHCEEGTAAVVIGPVNDVYLYRAMIDMGISDYLVGPVSKDVLADVSVKTLIERIGVTGSRLIAFIGAKGGVGTTSLAAATACGVADIIGQKTFLMDASGGWSTLNVGLGFEPSTTLAEAVKAAEAKSEDNLKRMFVGVGDKLNVLGSGGDIMLEPGVSAEQFEDLIDVLMMKYPVVIVDLSQSPHDLQKAVLARANNIKVVATPTLPALRQGRSLIQEIKDVRGGELDNIDLIINMQGLSSKQEVGKADIEAAMDMKIAASVTFDAPLFAGCEGSGQALIAEPAGKKLIEADLLPVVSKYLSGDAKGDKADDADTDKSLLGGFLKKLSAK